MSSQQIKIEAVQVTIVAAQQPCGRWKFLPKGYPTFFVNSWDNWSCNTWATKRGAINAGKREFANFLVRN
jgi:hypothetical protein